MWTLMLLSVCVSSTLVMALALCLCWQKKQQKDEFLGVDGMVTQKNPDENVNHLTASAPCVTTDAVSASATPSADVTDAKRNVPSTNPRRSLPDIPSEQGASVNWQPTGDNSSEHYATVEQCQKTNRKTLSNGVDARPSISQHSSISQADDASSPYEKVKYDKIKSNKEHPYAQLKPTTSRQATVAEEGRVNSEERVSLLRTNGSNSNLEPIPPPTSRRSSAQSGLGVDIPAASAVAGGIAASPELPYMTPPVTQPNFSGDSQDSKGYSSISVREPLANLIVQTKENNKARNTDDPYSDDSDEVYTTIPDSNQYTSGSETYARIPAHPITIEAEVNAEPSAEESDGMYEPAPQPPLPSVDSLKQVTGHSHSRQASSSSSIANIGSPKPEKRQANSPLPPPPTASTSFDFHADKVQSQKNLDDLYAKVHKNKKKDDSTDNESLPEKKNTSTIQDDQKRREHNYETLRKNKSTDPGYEKIAHEEPGYASINGPDSITSSDPGYEVLKKRPSSEAGDPNYEELQRQNSNASDCAGYSKIKPADGYSVINKQKKSEDRSRTSSSYGSNSQDLSLDEPNYESMPSESLSSDHNYAALKSDCDPNYESVSQTDPNYESVRDLDEPPYEKLHDEGGEIPGYERVAGRGYENIDTSESSNGAGDTPHRDRSEPPYEKLNNDTDSELPGYERIQAKGATSSSYKSDKRNVGNSSSSLLEENAIFQV